MGKSPMAACRGNRLARPRARACASILILGGMLVAQDAAAAKRPPARADIAPLSVALTGEGRTLQVRYKAINRGRRTAGPTVTRMYLSTDARLDLKARRVKTKKGTRRVLADPAATLTPRLTRLRSRRTTTARATATVPARLRSGRYRVFLCLDATRRVRESNERNNCRSTSLVLPLRRPAAAPVASPPPPAPTPAPAPGTPTPAPAPGGGAPPPATPGNPPADGGAQPGLPAGVVGQVAAVQEARNLPDAVASTSSMLRSAGIAVPTTSRSSTEPAAGISLGEFETMQVARDGRRSASIGRVTLDELATSLHQAGAPFAIERADGTMRDPGSSLRNFLAGTVRAALQHPDDAAAQAPLLLAALARSRTPSIDLTRTDYDPGTLSLTHLDLLLVTSILAQIAPVYRADQPPPASDSPRPRAAAATPCSDFKTYLEKRVTLSDVAFAYGTQKAVSAYMNEVASLLAKEVTEASTAAAQHVLSRTLAALGVLAKAQGIALLYSTAQAELVAGVDEVDKPAAGTPARPILFTVKAGVPDDEWEVYKANQPSDFMNSVRDCAAFAGLPTWTTAADIAGTIEKWRVEWRIVEGSGFHALMSAGQQYDFPGRLAEYLERRDDHTGTENVSLDILPARRPGTGPVLVEPVTVRAEIATDPPPNMLLWLSAAEAGADPLGLIGPVSDLVTGFIQNLATLDATKTVNVRFSDPGVWYGRIVETITNQYGVTFSSYSSGEGGAYSRTNSSSRRVGKTQTVTQIGAGSDATTLGVGVARSSREDAVDTYASEKRREYKPCSTHEYSVFTTQSWSSSVVMSDATPAPMVTDEGSLIPSTLRDPDARSQGTGDYTVETSDGDWLADTGLGNDYRCEPRPVPPTDQTDHEPYDDTPGHTLDVLVSGPPTERRGSEDVWLYQSERTGEHGFDLQTKRITVELRRRAR
ncbi:CARDB domain-containing protein [Paraconexibacter sp.]|uniref:CARDB domain-containing protein n=1 Tax=Paraconexibacter sp. TaxID=2949640 RepID=UPI00356AC59E